MPQLMEITKLNKAIGLIGRNLNKVSNVIQVAAVQCVAQTIVHRNTTPANNLVSALYPAMRQTAVAFMEKFGQVKWDAKEERLTFHNRDLTWTDEAEAAAMAFKWQSAKKPPKVVSEYDAVDGLSTFFESVRKKVRKGIAVKGLKLIAACEAAYMKERADEFAEELKQHAPEHSSQTATPDGKVIPVLTADRQSSLAATFNGTAEQAAAAAAAA